MFLLKLPLQSNAVRLNVTNFLKNSLPYFTLIADNDAGVLIGNDFRLIRLFFLSVVFVMISTLTYAQLPHRENCKARYLVCNEPC